MAKSLGYCPDQFIFHDQQSCQILEFYIPIALWLEEQVLEGKEDESEGAVCVGMSLPQGGGKTTLSNCMVSAMATLNIKTAVVSYDDFYKTHAELKQVKVQNDGNFYLSGRGVAGTHSLDLGADTLEQMVRAGWNGNPNEI